MTTTENPLRQTHKWPAISGGLLVPSSAYLTLRLDRCSNSNLAKLANVNPPSKTPTEFFYHGTNLPFIIVTFDVPEICFIYCYLRIIAPNGREVN